MSTHEHDHHDDTHTHGVTNISAVFFIALILNIGFVIIEGIYGLHINSLSLLSDAGHNMMDILNLILSGTALWISKIAATKQYTYGYKRGTIFSALINSILLIATSVYIFVEAIDRISHPVATEGVTMMIVASVGIFVNGISAVLLMRDGKRDINMRSAYLHMIADALVSFGVVIAGGLILITGYTIIDPIVSILVSLIMIWSIVGILRQSFRMSFDGIPTTLDLATIETQIASTDGVISYHHLHIWAISTTENALTVHIVTAQDTDTHRIKKEIKHLLEHYNIGHCTIEVEQRPCEDQICGTSLLEK